MAKGKKPTVETGAAAVKGKAPKVEKPTAGEQGGEGLINSTAPPPETVMDPATGNAAKAKALVVFKSLETNKKLPLYIKDKRGDEVKVYAHFKENTLATADDQYINHFNGMIAEYGKNETPLKQREVLTEEQYLSIVSPEKLYVPYHGNKLHLSRVTEGLEFAESKGWVPDYAEVIIVQSKKSRVRSGSISAGSAG